MAGHVDLDAMIPRTDFAVVNEPYPMTDLIKDFPVSLLARESPVLKLLRKPDFQRETNHWTPRQVVTFIASFVDGEVIPSLILWKSPRYIFVIDGGHRLSALRAWMEDDYGDEAISLEFYGGEITKHQRDIAKHTRRLVEKEVGRYSSLRDQVAMQSAEEIHRKRGQVLFTRALALQWVHGDANVAETSFFKINSQGTPLDATEGLLIRNRHKPISIGARAILRAGSGHKYWSSFNANHAQHIEAVAEDFHERIFKPEVKVPLKTLELPFGGTISPVDALALLVEFLTIAGTRQGEAKGIAQYEDDDTGESTTLVLRNGFAVLNRMAGNEPGSLGLHPAVYFYNERGKYSKFMFLGMVSLIQEALRNNNDEFFARFTKARKRIEEFLIDNKSLLGVLLQNLAKGQRIPKMKALFEFLVGGLQEEDSDMPVENVISGIGLRGRIVDVNALAGGPVISDETKSIVYVRQAIENALRCPICAGRLDPAKSVSYDHALRVRDGGTGDADNVQMAHPYCNTGYKH